MCNESHKYMDYKKEFLKERFALLILQSGCGTNIIGAVQKMRLENMSLAVLTENMKGDLKYYVDEMIEYGVGKEIIDYVTIIIKKIEEKYTKSYMNPEFAEFRFGAENE